MDPNIVQTLESFNERIKQLESIVLNLKQLFSNKKPDVNDPVKPTISNSLPIAIDGNILYDKNKGKYVYTKVNGIFHFYTVLQKDQRPVNDSTPLEDCVFTEITIPDEGLTPYTLDSNQELTTAVNQNGCPIMFKFKMVSGFPCLCFYEFTRRELRYVGYKAIRI